MGDTTIREIAHKMLPSCPDLRWITLDSEGVKGWEGERAPLWSGSYWVGRLAFSLSMDPEKITLPPTFKCRRTSGGHYDWKKMLWEAPIDGKRVSDEIQSRPLSASKACKVKAIGDGVDIVFDSYEECAYEFGLKAHQVKRLIDRGDIVPGTKDIYLDEVL